MSANSTILIHEADDVLVAKRDLSAGTVVRAGSVEIVLPAKRAGRSQGRAAGAEGGSAGPALRRSDWLCQRRDSRAGELVHIHNLDDQERHERSTSPVPAYRWSTFIRPSRCAISTAIERPDGRVGTRNYVALLSTVNCSASVTQFVRERFRDVQRDFPGVDGVIALTHKSGCGQVVGGEDHRVLERVLAGYARHPNVAAYVVIGLGCEVNQAPALVARHKLSLMADPRERPPVITIQAAGGIRKAVEAAVSAVARLLPRANEARRTKAAGLRARPGHQLRRLRRQLGNHRQPRAGMGGRRAGALRRNGHPRGDDGDLRRRAPLDSPGQDGSRRRQAHRSHGLVEAPSCGAWRAAMNDNPAPGNKTGGLTTLFENRSEEWPRGARRRSWTSSNTPSRSPPAGFVFMDTPGHDPVSITGLVAGGANVICFTTGRGSVLGMQTAPSIKLATNSPLFRRMEDDMDIDCGVILDGVSIEEVGRRIFEEVLLVASGKKSKSELSGVGEEEFAPWMMGPVL